MLDERGDGAGEHERVAVARQAQALQALRQHADARHVEALVGLRHLPVGLRLPRVAQQRPVGGVVGDAEVGHHVAAVRPEAEQVGRLAGEAYLPVELQVEDRHGQVVAQRVVPVGSLAVALVDLPEHAHAPALGGLHAHAVHGGDLRLVDVVDGERAVRPQAVRQRGALRQVGRPRARRGVAPDADQVRLDEGARARSRRRAPHFGVIV